MSSATVEPAPAISDPRELDFLIAEQVFGWQVDRLRGPDWRSLEAWRPGALRPITLILHDGGGVTGMCPSEVEGLPAYSTNIKHALTVVERLASPDVEFSLWLLHGRWWARFLFLRGDGTQGYECEAETPARAICGAALEAMRGERTR